MDVHTAAAVEERPWARPPLRLEFELPGVSASGLRVTFCSVTEPTTASYRVSRWVRYATTAGAYEVLWADGSSGSGA